MADDGSEEGAPAGSQAESHNSWREEPQLPFLDEVTVHTLQFAGKHDYEDVVVLEYDEGETTALAYVVPALGSPDLAAAVSVWSRCLMRCIVGGPRCGSSSPLPLRAWRLST